MLQNANKTRTKKEGYCNVLSTLHIPVANICNAVIEPQNLEAVTAWLLVAIRGGVVTAHGASPTNLKNK